jgi:hypothetical protein
MNWVWRNKVFFAAGMLVLLVGRALGESQPQISRPQAGIGKIFEYTASRFGVPFLKASIKIEEAPTDPTKSLLQVHAIFHSMDYLGLVFRMRNRFTSTVDAETCAPIRYVKEIDQEGLAIKNKHYLHVFNFDVLNKKVVVERMEKKEKEEISLPSSTYDPLSMFSRFYLKEDLHPGQDIPMSIYDGVKLRQMVFHSKKEKVKSKLYGEVDAVCLESTTSFSTFGEKEGLIRIWYIQDGGKTPILMQLDLPVGDVKFELESVSRG